MTRRTEGMHKGMTACWREGLTEWRHEDMRRIEQTQAKRQEGMKERRNVGKEGMIEWRNGGMEA